MLPERLGVMLDDTDFDPEVDIEALGDAVRLLVLVRDADTDFEDVLEGEVEIDSEATLLEKKGRSVRIRPQS